MKVFAAAIAVLVVCAVLFVRAPTYLVCSDRPQKADAVVLFLGNEYRDRKAEAIRLIRDGYAEYLLVPAYGKLARVPDFERSWRNGSPSRPSHYPVVYEDTHIEVLEAKRLMDKEGLTSAIFVSSPYHMRRIRLIADRVFPANYRILFVPTRFEKPINSLWFLEESNIRRIIGEYGKIAWFFIYRWLK